jgi:polyribonucleotide nucleotidyltransferase
MVGCSAALTLSGIPFFGPMGARARRLHQRRIRAEPALSSRCKESKLDLVRRRHRGRRADGRVRGHELTEEVMLGAVMFGHAAFQPVIQGIIELAEEGREGARDFTCRRNPPRAAALKKKLAELGTASKARPTRRPRSFSARRTWARPRRAILAQLTEDEAAAAKVACVFKALEADVVRWNILDTGMRIDGRDTKTVRPIVAEVHVLPRAHGSRCSPVARRRRCVVATLGTGQDEQYHRLSSPACTRKPSCCTTTSLRTR